ncbi:acetamidase/formamidase [Klebsormidium nitens]|uniref:Acetamidase/formamidase n=1 Tax=Klebsormidium nitens TaxID=105231 RepID=A0A1Y1HS93_KLENI|nr:acetamidase/formamidase [Klebsormidium nitens]|eukprot:GAQ80049.1 acetamidase/formamidase [Klebsormidium nitens]
MYNNFPLPRPMPPQQPIYPVPHYAAPPPQGYSTPGQFQHAPPVQTQQYAQPAAQPYQQNLPTPNHTFPHPNPPPQTTPPSVNQPMNHAAPPPNPQNGGYGRPGNSWETDSRRWGPGPEPNWNGYGPAPVTQYSHGQPNWNRSPAPPNPRVELYPVQNSPNPEFPPLQNPQPRPSYSQQFNPPQRTDNWYPPRNNIGEQTRTRPDNASGGPVRNNPRQPNPRNSNPRPQSNPPYEKPTPPKPTVYRQSVMPYFTTVKGEFTQLCVYTAQEKHCPDPKCRFSHVPKPERPCPAFHTPKEKCPFDSKCLLGHTEAREAVRQSKAFAKHKEWQSQVKTTPGTYGETDAAESGTDKANQAKMTPSQPAHNPATQDAPTDKHAPAPVPATAPASSRSRPRQLSQKLPPPPRTPQTPEQSRRLTSKPWSPRTKNAVKKTNFVVFPS